MQWKKRQFLINICRSFIDSILPVSLLSNPPIMTSNDSWQYETAQRSYG